MKKMSNHDQTEERLAVIGICGSIRPGSYTRMAMRIALQSAAEAGAQIQLLDLEKFQRGFFDGQSAETSLTTDVLRLRQEVRQARAIILGTPEYHGSFSGILKTTLDLLEGSELNGKIIGLISVAGGALGGLDALNGLRVICRSLQAWAIPQQVAIPEAWKLFDENGVLKNPALEKRLQE
jgi:FMN reductase